MASPKARPVQQKTPPRPLVVAGVMSGTSADGIDVALCRIAPRPSGLPTLRLLGHRSFPYPKPLRAAILAATAAVEQPTVSVADLSRLHWRLGEAYAEAVARTIAELEPTLGLQPALVSLHGQTLFHQATLQPFLGKPTHATWQAGEPAVLAERLRIPVLSDLRAADLAAGGQAAPLVPMLDLCLFRHRTRNRILLNLGGIANLTAIPAAGGLDSVLAFDTGPANMLLDAIAAARLGKPFDRNGATAAKGTPIQPLLDELLDHPFFPLHPPKSTGREQFGQPFADALLQRAANVSTPDLLATAAALTVRTVAEACVYCLPHFERHAPQARHTDLLVAGGGARNRTLMTGLREALEPRGLRVLTTADAGLPTEAKEAAAFALLGWLSYHRLPGNIPSATGAAHPVVLGRLTLA